MGFALASGGNGGNAVGGGALRFGCVCTCWVGAACWLWGCTCWGGTWRTHEQYCNFVKVKASVKSTNVPDTVDSFDESASYGLPLDYSSYDELVHWRCLNSLPVISVLGTIGYLNIVIRKVLFVHFGENVGSCDRDFEHWWLPRAGVIDACACALLRQSDLKYVFLQTSDHLPTSFDWK